MNKKVIKTETGYKKAIKRTITIFNAIPRTAEGDELKLLLKQVKDYEDRFVHLPA